MKRFNQMAAIIFHDKGLLGLLSGVIICGIALLSVAVTACFWYL